MKKYEEIKKIVIEGIMAGGFTIDKNAEHITKKEGFMVSDYGTEATLEKMDIEGIIKKVIEYLEMVQDKKEVYIGLWINEGLAYIDISKWIKNKKDALIRGTKNKQLAIYDLKENESITITETNYIIYKYIKAINDFQFIKEYKNKNEIAKDYNIKNIDSLRHYTTKDIDKMPSSLLKDNFVIVEDIQEILYY